MLYMSYCHIIILQVFFLEYSSNRKKQLSINLSFSTLIKKIQKKSLNNNIQLQNHIYKFTTVLNVHI